MKKIVVGLPTYNEADNILRTVQVIDRGLQSMPNVESCIVNADNNSPDGTAEIFSHLQLISKKHQIINFSRGKGINVLSIFEYARSTDTDLVVLFDSDVTSITGDWVPKMTGGILLGKADAVFPMYGRSRYDGTITNQLVFPSITALSGKKISQPIGGGVCL